jgi:enoyl-[acyl-carrier protein] reductase II
MSHTFCSLFNIKYPIIQAGMVWCSGYKLALASSKAGVLGVIGAGSMTPELLTEHIQKFKLSSRNSFAVNIPLLYAGIEKQLEVIIKEKVPVVITSAGNPKTYTQLLKNAGIKVIHVVSSEKFALKAQEAGVDAIIAEGFEAGGHNGREETTSLVLLQQLKGKLRVPLIAAGGFASGESIAAAFMLGVQAVQVGSLFAVSQESSAHQFFKQRVVEAAEGETILTLKELAPVRLIKNEFYQEIAKAYEKQATPAQLKELLGSGRSRKGIFEGDLNQGELEIGQVAALINNIPTVSEIVTELVNSCNACLLQAKNMTL